ncbi:MAG TPA: HNH endonuclease signature motif containing protein [Vicinamibacterales bacterium]|nr:HNH endonuclease signature motif containing protein [Vicinamibacterales bacterium]
MQDHTPIDRLSDRDLLEATERVAASERQLTVELLALLAELDARRLYLGQSCSSLFTYCTQVLRFSEHAAYHRIEAARAARQFPVILEMLADGALTLTTVTMLRPHLTKANHSTLLDAARHKSKREVEYQIACLAPRPDERAVLRKVPAAASTRAVARPLLPTRADPPLSECGPRSPATLAPLSAERFILKVTLSAEAHARLRRAQDLMRHTIPNGDPAMVIDRALTLLVGELERTKIATVVRPVRTPRSRRRRPSSSTSRHIPASIRRAVWARDDGRCAFVGARGRCAETSRLEFHHVIPFVDGGPTTVENLALRCQAHNAHEARLWSPM